MKKINTIVGLAIVAIIAVGGVIGGNVYVNKAKEEYKAYEAEMPESAISTYFAQLNNQDYDGIYNDSMTVYPHMNSKDAYISKLTEIYSGVDTSNIQYVGTDNGDGTKDYKLYNNGTYLATLRLMQTSDGQWLASTIFDGNLDYTLEVPTGLTPTINGIALDASTMTEQNVNASNFSGLSSAYDSGIPKVDVYVVENLLGEPEIGIEGESGYTTMKDVLTNHLFIGKASEDSDEANTFITDAKICAGFPAQDTSLSQVAAISVTNSDWYERVSGVQNQWFTSHSVSSFSNENAFNIIHQSDDTMVGYVTFDYYASNGEVDRTWNCGYQMTFIKENGTWKIAGMAIDNELNPNKVTPLQD